MEQHLIHCSLLLSSSKKDGPRDLGTVQVALLPYFGDKKYQPIVQITVYKSKNTMQFALKNRMPVATSASTQASRVIAPATVTRMSVSTRARSMLFPRLASSQGARTIVAQASPRDVSVDATKSEVKGQSSRLTIKKGDPSNFALGILGDLHMDPRDLAHSFEGREHVKAALATEENTFVVRSMDRT